MQHSFFGSGEWWNPLPPALALPPPPPPLPNPLGACKTANISVFATSAAVRKYRQNDAFGEVLNFQRTSDELQRNFRGTSGEQRPVAFTCWVTGHASPLAYYMKAVGRFCPTHGGGRVELSTTRHLCHCPLQSQPGTDLSHSRPRRDRFVPQIF